MKKLLITLVSAFLLPLAAQQVTAEEEFTGIVESRPESTAGTWVIGGRSIEVTESVELDEEDGPLSVGACAEVDIENGVVEEIESEPDEECQG